MNLPTKQKQSHRHREPNWTASGERGWGGELNKQSTGDLQDNENTLYDIIVVDILLFYFCSNP